jgi:hypothetical protein
VVNLVGLVLRVVHQLLEFGYVLPGLAQVQRTEVFVEIIIEKVLSTPRNTLSILK